MTTLTFDTSSIESYRQFIAVKQLPHYRIRGREAWFPDEYAALLQQRTRTRRDIDYTPPEWMFDYQKAMMPVILRKRKFALLWDCGLGKTPMFFEFARVALDQMRRKLGVLILSPLNVVSQTLDECRRFYSPDELHIERVASHDLGLWLETCSGKVGITNYDGLKPAIRQGQLGALILDECFAPGTPVDVIRNGCVASVPIESVRAGDAIVNASGIDTVVRTKQRRVTHAYAITAGKRIVCSPNHPFFTQRGWVCAQDLEPGDSVLSTVAAMRMVRNGVHAQGHARNRAILRSILFSEMEDEPTAICCPSSCGIRAQETGRSESSLVSEWQSSSDQGTGAYPGLESNVAERVASEDVSDPQGDGPQTFRAWGQWDWFDRSAADDATCSWSRLDSGVLFVTGPNDSRLSKSLQARLGAQRSTSRYRGGWSIASFPQAARYEERFQAGFTRVERVEVLESGHTELDQYRDANGALYFHDIEAARHPSFSVNGLLVHNSSVLKSHYGKWGQTILRLGRGLDWKLSCTGTPAPNDRIEYANQAVFLDQFSTVNGFLSTFFVNRGQTCERWSLKPHALRPFYRVLSHWCHFLSDPSVYGWRDNCDHLPPIHVHIHTVDMTPEQTRLVREVTGELFASRMGGITRRASLGQVGKGFYRGRKIASNKPAFVSDLIDSWRGDESTLVWCLYNAEQSELARLLPDSASIDGATKYDDRMERIGRFKSRNVSTLVSKPKILGFGLNLQVATRQVFSGLADSYESYYQAVKRSNRYGSTKPLHVHIPVTDIEEPMVQNVLRKARMVQADTEEQERLFKELAVHG